jgi:hypothetical protein
MKKIRDYPKVYNLGHRGVQDLFKDPVSVEEKVDGSQFSFGIIDGELSCKSHHQQINMDEPPKMFKKAIETVRNLEPRLYLGWIYRCEYLEKPKHNVLCYDRVPDQNLVIFDIEKGESDFLTVEQRNIEASRLGLEAVEVFFEGILEDYSTVVEFLGKLSMLGGQQIEGLVFKNHNRFGIDGKILVGKHVSESFKERHGQSFKTQGKNPQQEIGESLNTEARWEKAIQHLREQELLTDSPKDIGPLLKEIQLDIQEECADEIKELLFKAYWIVISKIATNGFPQWYKDRLAKQ